LRSCRNKPFSAPLHVWLASLTISVTILTGIIIRDYDTFNFDVRWWLYDMQQHRIHYAIPIVFPLALYTLSRSVRWVGIVYTAPIVLCTLTLFILITLTLLPYQLCNIYGVRDCSIAGTVRDSDIPILTASALIMMAGVIGLVLCRYILECIWSAPQWKRNVMRRQSSRVHFSDEVEQHEDDDDGDGVIDVRQNDILSASTITAEDFSDKSDNEEAPLLPNDSTRIRPPGDQARLPLEPTQFRLSSAHDNENQSSCIDHSRLSSATFATARTHVSFYQDAVPLIRDQQGPSPIQSFAESILSPKPLESKQKEPETSQTLVIRLDSIDSSPPRCEPISPKLDDKNQQNKNTIFTPTQLMLQNSDITTIHSSRTINPREIFLEQRKRQLRRFHRRFMYGNAYSILASLSWSFLLLDLYMSLYGEQTTTTPTIQLQQASTGLIGTDIGSQETPVISTARRYACALLLYTILHAFLWIAWKSIHSISRQWYRRGYCICCPRILASSRPAQRPPSIWWVSVPEEDTEEEEQEMNGRRAYRAGQRRSWFFRDARHLSPSERSAMYEQGWKGSMRWWWRRWGRRCFGAVLAGELALCSFASGLWCLEHIAGGFTESGTLGS
jgi:hypothetical protein